MPARHREYAEHTLHYTTVQQDWTVCTLPNERVTSHAPRAGTLGSAEVRHAIGADGRHAGTHARPTDGDG